MRGVFPITPYHMSATAFVTLHCICHPAMCRGRKPVIPPHPPANLWKTMLLMLSCPHDYWRIEKSRFARFIPPDPPADPPADTLSHRRSFWTLAS
jgi:hypothetical protein